MISEQRAYNKWTVVTHLDTYSYGKSQNHDITLYSHTGLETLASLRSRHFVSSSLEMQIDHRQPVVLIPMVSIRSLSFTRKQGKWNVKYLPASSKVFINCQPDIPGPTIIVFSRGIVEITRWLFFLDDRWTGSNPRL